MTSISNFGQDGPYRDFEATELGLYALSGAMATIGDPEREPIKKGGYLTQYTAGGHAFLASLAALWSREETGQGQHVDVSIAECMATIVAGQTKRLTYGGKMAGREVGHQSSDYPYGVLPCRDGYVEHGRPAGQHLADHRRHRRRAEAGRGALPDPARPRPARRRDRAGAAALAGRARQGRDLPPRPAAAGRARLRRDGRPTCSTRRSWPSESFFVEVDHPRAGRLRYPGAPYRLGESEWTAAPAPLLGEHNEEVLCRPARATGRPTWSGCASAG